MKRLLLSLAAALAVLPLLQAQYRQVRYPIHVPERIPGWTVLKGDMHIHTIFSDGTVWPSNRVDEAVVEGLDLICITDHLEDRHRKQVKAGIFNGYNVDRNTSYEIAERAAVNAGVLIVSAAGRAGG